MGISSSSHSRPSAGQISWCTTSGTTCSGGRKIRAWQHGVRPPPCLPGTNLLHIQRGAIHRGVVVRSWTDAPTPGLLARAALRTVFRVKKVTNPPTNLTHTKSVRSRSRNDGEA
jgi:hypothetical protein